MDSTIVQDTLRVLRPVIRSPRKAEQLLERHWQDKMAIIWTVDDVYRAANEIKVALTRQEAVKVLKLFHQAHNRQYGLRWSDITSHITENVLGRPLTKTELNRFVHKDIITINS